MDSYSRPDSWLVRRLRRAYKRAVKLVEFIKLGWEDRDWDYMYTYALLEYKIKKMETLFKESSIHDDHKFSQKVCRVLRKSMKKFLNEDFYEDFLDKNCPIKYSSEVLPAVRESSGRQFYTMVDCIPGTKTPHTEADRYIISYYRIKAFEVERGMKKKYKAIFYNTLSKYMDTLWD